jgi:hypothetical protein
METEMRRRLAVLPIAILLLPAVAHAQTPPPGSSAMALVTGMQQAVAATSLRYNLTVKATDGKKAIDIAESGRLSIPTQSVKVTSTTTRRNLKTGHVATEASQMEVVEPNGAWRTGKASWHCENLSGTNLDSQILALELEPQSAVLTSTATANGVTVERLQVKGKVPAWTQDKVDTVEVDLAQGTELPVSVRFSAKAVWGRDKEKVTVSEVYSDFGKPVTVSLPRQCRG